MALIEEDLYQALLDGVPAVEGRVFANIMAQDTPKPALVYLVSKEELEVKVDGSCGGSLIDWEILCYGDAYMALKQVKIEVLATIASFGHEVSSHPITVQDAFDDDAELFVQVIKFKTRS